MFLARLFGCYDVIKDVILCAILPACAGNMAHCAMPMRKNPKVQK